MEVCEQSYERALEAHRATLPADPFPCAPGPLGLPRYWFTKDCYAPVDVELVPETVYTFACNPLRVYSNPVLNVNVSAVVEAPSGTIPGNTPPTTNVTDPTELTYSFGDFLAVDRAGVQLNTYSFPASFDTVPPTTTVDHAQSQAVVMATR